MTDSQAKRNQSRSWTAPPAPSRIPAQHAIYWSVCGVVRGVAAAGVTQIVTHLAPGSDAR